MGVDHTCAVSAQGQLPCFGWNAYGQCDVPEDLGMVAAVAAGGGHTCAVTAQRRLLCFEWNAYGQCDVPEDIPVRLEGVSKGFRLGRPFADSLRKQLYVFACSSAGDTVTGVREISWRTRHVVSFVS